eukprot:3311354-Pyramimonas_sp.AAC.1
MTSRAHEAEGRAAKAERGTGGCQHPEQEPRTKGVKMRTRPRGVASPSPLGLWGCPPAYWQRRSPKRSCDRERTWGDEID